MMVEPGRTVIRIGCPGCRKSEEVRGEEVNGIIRVVCPDCGYRWGIPEKAIRQIFSDARREGDVWVRGPGSP